MYRDQHHQQVKNGVVQNIDPGHRFANRRQHRLLQFAVLFKLDGVSGDHQQDDQNINLRPRENERIAIGFKQREEKVALIKPGK